MNATGTSFGKRNKPVGKDMSYLRNLIEKLRTGIYKLIRRDGTDYEKLGEIKEHTMKKHKFQNIQEVSNGPCSGEKHDADHFSSPMSPFHFLLLWFILYFLSCSLGACMLNDNYAIKDAENHNLLENSTDMILALVKNLPVAPMIKYNTAKVVLPRTATDIEKTLLNAKVEEQILKLKRLQNEYKVVTWYDVPLYIIHLFMVCYATYMVIAMIKLCNMMKRNTEKEVKLGNLSILNRLLHLSSSSSNNICDRLETIDKNINATNEELQKRVANIRKEIKDFQTDDLNNFEEIEMEIEKVKCKESFYQKIVLAHMSLSLLVLICFATFYYIHLDGKIQNFNKNSFETSKMFECVKTLIWQLIKK